MLWAYLDETGISGSGTATIVGGLIGKMEDWTRLEPRWRRRVTQDGVSMFHATKCRGGHDEYHAWRPDWERMKRHYADLAKIAADYPLRPVCGAVLTSDWERFEDPRLKARFESPYVFCFELCLFHIQTIAKSQRDSVYVVYSANEQYAGRAGELATAYVIDRWYFPNILSCKPALSKRVAALQAADMAAFEMYHLFHSKNSAKRPELNLMNHLDSGDLSNGFYYNYEGLKMLADRGPMDFIIGQADQPSSDEELF